MIIGGLQKLSLIDYPSKLAAVVFTRGCNFRCVYCHNPGLISCNIKKQAIPVETVYEFLVKRIGMLDGVVITGGEPTLHDDLADFIEQIKQLGYLVKLDTNGSNPRVVSELLEKNLLDFIAMDIKAPFDKYYQVVKQHIDIESIRESINIIVNSGIAFQFRTTLAQPLLNYRDAVRIKSTIEPFNLNIQECRVESTLDRSLSSSKQFSHDEIEAFQNKLDEEVSNSDACCEPMGSTG